MGDGGRRGGLPFWRFVIGIHRNAGKPAPTRTWEITCMEYHRAISRNHHELSMKLAMVLHGGH